MNKKIIEILGIVALALIVILGIMLMVNSKGTFGTSLTYSSAADHIETYNILQSIITDLQGSYGFSTSTTFNPNKVLGGLDVASTTLNVPQAALGDFCIASYSTSTNYPNIMASCNVASAGVVNYQWRNTTSTATSNLLSSTTIYARVIPAAQSQATATTTAANR